MSNKSTTRTTGKHKKPEKCGKTSKKRVTSCTPLINTVYTQGNFQKELTESFIEKHPMANGEDVILSVNPFSVCILPNFVTPEPFLEHLKDELADQIFYEKNNDLYKFQQTDDLKKISSPYVQEMRKFLCGPVRKWLSEVTGFDLNEKVDATCSRYDYTDTLLCHDDELDTRRIAFVLYLVPSWKLDDGGCLDLFDMDEHLQPQKLVKSIVPAFNQLVWFEVTEASHHQVSEVLCQCKSRLSVNGWFHTKPVPRAPRFIEPRVPLHSWTDVEEDVFYDWINPIYLDPEVQSQIQCKFEKDSEIELQGFIQEEKYQAVIQALKCTEINWLEVGPPNKRKYQRANLATVEGNQDNSTRTTTLPAVLHDCLQFLQSEMMFLTLSNLTGLSLHPMACDNYDEDSDEAQRSNSISPDKMSTDFDFTTSNDQTAKAIAETSNDFKNDKNGDTSNVDIEQKHKNNETLSSKMDNGVNIYHDCDNTDSRSILNKEKIKPIIKRRKLEEDSNDVDDKEKTNNSEASVSVVATSEELNPCNPKCCGEVRKWQQNNYTLIHDTDTEGMEFALDAMLFCSCKGWEESFGGYTSYITKGEDEELLTVVPSENSLALVYRDKDTLRFVKHINETVKHSNKIESQEFYDFSLVYYE